MKKSNISKWPIFLVLFLFILLLLNFVSAADVQIVPSGSSDLVSKGAKITEKVGQFLSNFILGVYNKIISPTAIFIGKLGKDFAEKIPELLDNIGGVKRNLSEVWWIIGAYIFKGFVAGIIAGFFIFLIVKGSIKDKGFSPIIHLGGKGVKFSFYFVIVIVCAILAFRQYFGDFTNPFSLTQDSPPALVVIFIFIAFLSIFFFLFIFLRKFNSLLKDYK